ncbi:MAG: hypothetical protein HYV29_14840 [Ignavibacteriales bacterium]|nr:hypothetical protein [Ignavibacteriales bacterium]
MKWFLIFAFCSVSAVSQSFTSFVRRIEQLPVEQRAVAVQRYLSTIRSAPIIEGDSLLHFVSYGMVKTVLINGDLQGWTLPDTMNKIECGNISFFYKTFVVPSDARFDYKIIVDGTERLDPANVLVAPSGYGPHSEVRMPGFVSSPYLVPRENVPRGTIENIEVNPHITAPLKQYSLRVRPLKIYIPPGYDTLSHLPVIYVQDGFETIEFAFLPTVIDNLIADKKINPLIAVFIPPLRRGDEHMGYQRDQYKKYLCDELVPMIDEKYKTDRSPSRRTLVGISSGGFSSLYTVFNRPDIFLKVGGQSSTITPELKEIVSRKADRNLLPPSMKIYLDCGRYDLRRNNDDDFVTLNRSFSGFLSSLRIPHFYKEVNDGHQWGSWRERMPEMLTYFFGKLP